MNETKLDPRIRYLHEQIASARLAFAESIRVGAVVETDRQAVGVDVLLRCKKERGKKTVRSVEKKLTEYGVKIVASVDGPTIVVSGSVSIDRLNHLLTEDWIEVVEAATQMFPDLDLSGADLGARPLHTVPPTVRGTGVLVGVIDSGIDFAHDDFRHPDGTSRIQFLWDQSASSVTGDRVPFGREYTSADINAALRTQPAPIRINHSDRVHGHGTHVAGIAAGNGRRSNGEFMGMAPDADSVIVAVRSDGGTLGESTSALAACRYIVDRARELNRPVAINMSLGNNGGGHSGETPLETAMDNLAREPGVVLVKSAGNEQTWRIHTSGIVAQNATERRQFESLGNNVHQDVFEVWFDAVNQIGIAVQPPGEPTPTANDFVLPGAVNTFQTAANNTVRIDSMNVDANGTGDVRAVVFIGRGTAPRIQPGRWSLHFRGDRIADGTFHAWIERTARGPGITEQSRFTVADNDPSCTISIPGTARRVITVGSYVTRYAGDAAVGELSRFSSRGPTRYSLRKPEVAAPGEEIASTLSSAATLDPFAPGYALMPGTSMAAPHVAGAAALLLEINPRFTCEQVKQVLAHSARRDGAAAAAPDDHWGSGRLSVQRAVELAREARFPVVTHTVINGTRLEWVTDIQTTGAVRFNSHKRRMALGRSTGSRASLTPGTQHVIDLQGLPPATYYCEILAFATTPEEWETIDDNQGQQFTVVVT